MEKNPNDISYGEKGILKNCGNLGIETEVIVKSTEVNTEEMLELFKELNANPKVSGVLLFRPGSEAYR